MRKTRCFPISADLDLIYRQIDQYLPEELVVQKENLLTRHHWWLWVFVSEVVVFVLDPSRSGDVPLRYFGPEAKGIVNTDRYNKLALQGLVRALCWTHFRRDFVEAGESLTALKPWADEWIKMIT